MAASTNGTVALLSIRPVFAEAIFAGTKRAEFRRVRFQRDVGHVVVYETSPVQRVLGYFEVAAKIEAAPRRLWSMFGACSGISKAEFDRYYEGSKRGVAIEVGEVWRLHEPMELEQLQSGLAAPQGYVYLSTKVLERLMQQKAQPCSVDTRSIADPLRRPTRQLSFSDRVSA